MPRRRIFFVLLCFLSSSACGWTAVRHSVDPSFDDVSALWSYYRHQHIRNGRVVEWDEGGITTSEAQSYAMLRAVWVDDPRSFDEIWNWTRRNLAIRGDHLFAWKWDRRVLDRHSATDADTDIALALLLASRRFARPAYEQDALPILADIWDKEIAHIGRRSYVTAGDWALAEPAIPIHVAYLAPYAYAEFAGVDIRHPWRTLVHSSYDILDWLYFDQRVKLPPQIIYLDKARGKLRLADPRTGQASLFSYDAFPIFWRMALDAHWFQWSHWRLRRQMLAFFQDEWRRRGAFYDAYSIKGEPRSAREGLPLYATVHALAMGRDTALARSIESSKLARLRDAALAGRSVPYYLHNWLWFDLAFETKVTRDFDEILGFLRPFDVQGFSTHFPTAWFVIACLLGLFCRRSRAAKTAFLIAAFGLCARYLAWRFSHSLNFLEPAGPTISILLLGAEFYSFSTVILLLVQVGLGGGEGPAFSPSPGFEPTVDVFIPIYSESCEILERTLVAACAIDYANKEIYVLDDSHRETVKALTDEFGASYIAGPRRHAKAGNLNNALSQTEGTLVVVFDTDHMPVASFLKETVPYFADEGMGCVQTPHHFFNEDIFQRAFRTGDRVPDEQDMFNHGIQSRRDAWGGAFFVGSGAVFRRKALTGLGGFNLMSITEDIHTSQHLHAAGWKSAFVNKDLAAGLTAENLASYVVQRRRWMLGCLQIFFKDNPLLCRGLSLRHRFGYFASLYYFFFPVARVIYWATPLYYLLFHWHPMLANISVLLAYLVPMMVMLPWISSVLIPGWPRAGWGPVYETAVGFPLLRSMADLILPKKLAFKVTPKGITSERRVFDAVSARAVWLAALLTGVAITKGLAEFHYFGIEKDAYFFNLAWACYNLLFLLAALLVAWEKPQRRGEERLKRILPVRLGGGAFSRSSVTYDISLSGFSLQSSRLQDLPETVEAVFGEEKQFSLPARLVYNARASRREYRAAYAFADLSAEHRRELIRMLYSPPNAWAGAHDDRAANNFQMLALLFVGMFRYFQPLHPLPVRPRHAADPAAATENG